jgi:Suppressor of fused protein (SUFU)
MPSLRRGAGQARISAGSGMSAQPAVLLDQESPYGSRRVVVEYDGATTAAYVHDSAGPIAATWIANHSAAPQSVDVSVLSSGRAPQMPADHTKHPQGRPLLDPDALSALWLEEGDGVAVLERGTPIALIPGWSDMSTGMPGYAIDIIGQTPFGWSLDQAMEGLGPRIAEASRFWSWRSDAATWASYRQAVFGHLLGRLGPGGKYWDVSGGRQPLVGVSERPPTAQRPYTVLSTVGMSCQRMPVIEQAGEGAAGRARIELALATTMPSAEAARIFLWLAQYPWREVTWLGAGHSVPWYHKPGTFPLGGSGGAGGSGYSAVLLLDEPGRLLGPDVPQLGGFTVSGAPVRWLWLVPISERERLLAAERGSGSLVTQLAAQRRSWVAG